MNTPLLKTVFGIFAVALVFLIVVKGLNVSYPLAVQVSTVSGELAVVGEGKVDVVPDTALADVGITVANEPTVEAVQQQINTTNNAIIEALGKLNVPKKNITTSNYSVYPNYTYDNSGGPGTITGYAGNVTISIKLNDTNKLSEVIEAATNAGANQIYSTQFIVENPETYREQARNKAIQNAKEQAAQLAKSLGIRLGKVVNVVESNSSTPGVLAAEQAYRGGGLGGGAGVPQPDFQTGTQTVTSTVTLYFQK